jgi:hypothetical protein
VEHPEKILVLKWFDSPIDANLAKTKLDAYGIPNFLGSENFGQLYPNILGHKYGVSLHVFERDSDRATEILDHQAGDPDP